MNESNVPHENLYTRLKTGSKGIGVFAIRDIPIATKLFVGDTTETVSVPVADVNRLRDVEVQRMYYDFCPVINAAFVAPINFNQMTMAWYINHSTSPNVATDELLQFFSIRFIALGEELTADYVTFSEHASLYVRSWKS